MVNRRNGYPDPALWSILIGPWNLDASLQCHADISLVDAPDPDPKLNPLGLALEVLGK